MVPGIVGVVSALTKHILSVRRIEKAGRSILSSFNLENKLS
jgi:hypothetical protein